MVIDEMDRWLRSDPQDPLSKIPRQPTKKAVIVVIADAFACVTHARAQKGGDTSYSSYGTVAHCQLGSRLSFTKEEQTAGRTTVYITYILSYYFLCKYSTCITLYLASSSV